MDLFDVEKLNDFKNDGKSFIGLSRRIRVNPLIAEYYVRLGDDYNDLVVTRGEDCVDFPFKMNRRANRILNCGRMIESKRWKTLGVHEVSSLKRCGDKFCGNCQKLLANTREHKYTPLLNELNKKYDLYHIALTVPNVAGDKLPGTVGNIIKAFGKMIKYFLGRKKIRGLNLMNFGCVGAIRSMEITMNRTMTTYHPHLHCIFVFPKGLALDEPKVFANAFSYDNGRKVRQFSAFEVLVQKLWACCFTGVKVTAKSVKETGGYSCIVNLADGNYHQIFKYAIAGLLADKKKAMRHDHSIERGLKYEEFRDLYFSLENRRAMQGYGCFYGLKFDDSILSDDEETTLRIKDIVDSLNKFEDSDIRREKLSAVIDNIVNRNEIYFSSKTIKGGLDSLKNED